MTFSKKEFKKIICHCLLFFIALIFLDQNSIASEKNLPPGEIYEKLNSKINLDLVFTNQDNQKQSLKNLVNQKKILVITLNYFSCTTMCSLQFANLATALQEMNWPIGQDFVVASLSFNPQDTPAIAKEKQHTWLPKTGQKQGQWEFLVGDSQNISILAQNLNFYFERDHITGEYSHSSGLFFIKPDGTFYRYLYGIVYQSKDIKTALIETSNQNLGSYLDKIIAYSKKFQSHIGKYESKW
jgi:protein SCO1/2